MHRIGPAYVGVLLIELSMPWAKSLKEKRSLIMPVTEKLKVRFPVSVARLAGLDAHDWELIGVSAISHDAVWLEGMLRKALDFVGAREATVLRSQLDIEAWELEQ
ncbi:MAG: DUF503 domain-containing protein [Trueperaceae bacterium]